KSFNQLYASSGYLGEGQFLSLSNLLMVAPGVAISPTAETDLSVEYGFARRLQERDAAYAGGMRPYVGTQNVPGRDIGGLFRVIGSWSVCSQLTVFLNYEHLTPGAVLKGIQRPAGSYAYVGASFRY
ncbi:alginate export family protein, partial [Niveibacterium sp.]|uniref:alginate export family protein n=1 Tax=Niveibacterium sp. TaxID=2017444 RepID=UPI0035B276E9